MYEKEFELSKYSDEHIRELVQNHIDMGTRSGIKSSLMGWLHNPDEAQLDRILNSMGVE